MNKREEARKHFELIMRKPAAKVLDDVHTTPGRSKMHEQLVTQYVEWGFSGQQCADAHLHETGVKITRAAVSLFRDRIGKMARDANPHQKALIPWRVRSEFSNDRYLRTLRAEARIRNGDDVNQPSRYTHDKVLLEMEDGLRVIHYDNVNGFRLVPRRPGIDKDLIREPLLDGEGNIVENHQPLRRNEPLAGTTS